MTISRRLCPNAPMPKCAGTMSFARPPAWLSELPEQELLLLGLRWRYRLSQREVSKLFGVHEGTITRQIDKLRDRCLEQISKQLIAEGWDGDNLEGFVLTEMGCC